MNVLLKSNQQIVKRIPTASRKYTSSHYGVGLMLAHHPRSTSVNFAGGHNKKHRNGLLKSSNHQLFPIPIRYPFASYYAYREFRLGGIRYEHVSSKVEATVKTMKNKQQEKVEGIINEVVGKSKEGTAASVGVGREGDLPGREGDASRSEKNRKHGKKGKADSASTSTSTVTASSASTSSSAAEVETSKDVAKTEPKKSLGTRIWEELVHYYHGFRLLFLDVNVCRKLLWQVLNGKTLTRRENKLLVRTTSDLFRLIPFSVFIIVPFMELLLPFFIKFFPGMLPSTFQTAKEREDKLKQSLQVKLEMAKFLQQTLDEMAVQHKEHKSEEAKQFVAFFEKIKDPNEHVSTEEIIKYAKRFEDEITLDSLSREQLVALCRVLELNTMGTTNFLRFQLRLKLRSLRADDREIAREGVQSLDLFELQQACKARGMRAYGLTSDKLRYQLQEWIDLSLNEKVPPTLLLLSRALLISDDSTTHDKLKETIRVLPESVAKQTKAAIGEREGKIDNKTKIEIIKEEERKIKEEQEEEKEEQKAQAEAAVLLDKSTTSAAANAAAKATSASTEVLAESSVESAKPKVESKIPSTPFSGAAATASPQETEDDSKISSKDVELLTEAVKALSSDKKKLVVEKEVIKDLREELEEYKEDVEELREVRQVVKEPVHESRAAKLLFKKVNSMLGQLDKALEDFEKKNEQGATLEAVASSPSQDPKKDDTIQIDELITTIRKLKRISDDTRMKQIENILSKIDMDKDGVISVDDVLKITEALVRENVKLDEHQLEELVCLLYKEQLIVAEEKIEKALAKSKKEALKVKAQTKRNQEIAKAKAEAVEGEELHDKALVVDEKSSADTLKDKATVIADKAKDMNVSDSKNNLELETKPSEGAPLGTPATNITPPPPPPASKSNAQHKTK